MCRASPDQHQSGSNSHTVVIVNTYDVSPAVSISGSARYCQRAPSERAHRVFEFAELALVPIIIIVKVIVIP